MKQLQVQVFSSVDARSSGKVLFERIVDVNDALDVPFNNLLESLKFMYGLSAVIQFSVL